MGFKEVEANENNFSEVTLSDKQPLVTNALGRAVDPFELIYQDGYFGEVREYGGIANGETGRINIDSDRTIRTEQVEATDTFVVGNTIWFKSGGAGAAGTLVDTNSGSDYAAGIITEEEGTGGAQTSVTFRPFAQRLDAADVSAQVITNTAGIATNVTSIGTLASLTTTAKTSAVVAINEVNAEADANAAAILVEQAEPKILVVEVAADHSSAVTIAGLVDGDKIIGMSSICNVTETSGTIQLLDGASAAISDALQQATANEIAYAATFDVSKSVLASGGAKLIATGSTAANVRCTVKIEYIPA